MWKCSICGRENRNTNDFCPDCGLEQAKDICAFLTLSPLTDAEKEEYLAVKRRYLKGKEDERLRAEEEKEQKIRQKEKQDEEYKKAQEKLKKALAEAQAAKEKAEREKKQAEEDKRRAEREKLRLEEEAKKKAEELKKSNRRKSSGCGMCFPVFLLILFFGIGIGLVVSGIEGGYGFIGLGIVDLILIIIISAAGKRK